MSYILDALRRADAERERGHVPGIHAQPTRMAPTTTAVARPAPRRWLWAAVALPLALLLGWLTWRVVSSEAGAPAVGGSGVAPPYSALATPPATVPVPAPALVPTTAVPAAQRSTAAESPASTPPAVVADRSVAPPAPARKTAPPPLSANKLASASLSAASSSSRGSAASAAGGATLPAKVYALDELPEDVRRELPKLAIGGSIYSESAASRFVIVNGQLCHEGDTLAPGLVLQQIKLKSAVLAFRGYRYAISL